MNTKSNKELFEDHEVIALKADKGKIPDAVAEILIELGNPSQAIPYYAIYGPGISDPITLDGPITFAQVTDAIEKARGQRVGLKLYSPEKLDALLQEGQNVLVQYLAPNDATMLVNEISLFGNEKIQEALSERKVTVLTVEHGKLSQEKITQYLESYSPAINGSSFYALFCPDSNESIVLNGLIQGEDFLSFIDRGTGSIAEKKVVMSNR